MLGSFFLPTTIKRHYDQGKALIVDCYKVKQHYDQGKALIDICYKVKQHYYQGKACKWGQCVRTAFKKGSLQCSNTKQGHKEAASVK